MFEGLKHLVSLDRPLWDIARDFADILLVTFIIYRALLVLKGTRAMQMGIGFLAFGGLYLMGRYAQLATVNRLLSELAGNAILILIIVFQNDIRRALVRVGQKAWLSRGVDAQQKVLEEVVKAARELARHRIGALIVLERDANVLEFVKDDGIELDAMVTSELLVSLFLPEATNKIHDGAVLIRDLRVARGGMFLPMNDATKVPDPQYGSRHRAAFGISEETDAIVVVVSEERGTMTVVLPNANYFPNLSADRLTEVLSGVFGTEASRRRSIWERLGIRRDGDGTRAESKKEPQPTKKAKVEGSGKIERDDADEAKRSREKKKDEGARETPRPSSVKSGVDERTTTKIEVRESSKSGRFSPIPRSVDTPRVSVPMPSSKDRKSAHDDEPPSRRVSTPMKATELPVTDTGEHEVSRPMERADVPEAALDALADDSVEGTLETTARTTRSSVSTPMQPTKLPRHTVPGEDS